MTLDDSAREKEAKAIKGRQRLTKANVFACVHKRLSNKRKK